MYNSAKKLIVLAVAGFGLCFLTVNAAGQLVGLFELASGTKTPTPTATVTATAPASTVTVDYTPIAIAVVVIVGLIILGLLAYFLYSRKFKVTKNLHTENQSRWDSAVRGFDETFKEWSSYELDVMKLIDYPAMSDVKDPYTSRMLDAYRKAVELKPVDMKQAYKIDANQSMFIKAVDEYRKAFSEAENHAEDLTWSNYSVEEQKQLETTKALLEHVFDTATTPQERQTFYKKALKNLKKLIKVTPRALQELEAQHQKLELTH